MALQDLLTASARSRGSDPAVIEGQDGRRMDYATLERLSDRTRDRLAAFGVRRGDRVGVYLSKSADAVAVIFGILKAGGAYVPVDSTGPPGRNAYIHSNCAVKAAVVELAREADYRAALRALGPLPPMLVLDGVGGGRGLEAALDARDAEALAPVVRSAQSAPDDLAYILYTSGSTGTPKGVMLSHRNALAFLDWCSATFDPSSADVFSAHAPFHFDLSVFDLYVPIRHGACLVLVPETAGKAPEALAALIAAHRITVWYSAPSILTLLGQFGRLARYDLSSLRRVLFAGEVWPVVHLRAFTRLVPGPRYFNLYGPTETNVCTWHEIPRAIPDDRVDPYPIGTTCPQLRSRVVGADGRDVPQGAEGELCIAGPNVMQGYWGLPEQTAAAFLASDGLWYKTGDLVRADAEGVHSYCGRRDRMVKKRGYRVELGEIEACLYRHPAIREAAVVALADRDGGVRVQAHLVFGDERRPSLIALKTFCATHLPLYMVPDAFAFHAALPRTSTDKIDYLSLRQMG